MQPSAAHGSGSELPASRAANETATNGTVTNGTATNGAGELGLVPRILLLGVAYYLSSRLGRALLFPGSYLSVVWPPNTVLLVALLLSPPRRWAWLLALTFPVHVLAQAIDAVPLLDASLYYVYDVVLVVAVAALLRRAGLGRLALGGLRQTLLFLSLTGGVTAVATLVWSPLIVGLWQGGDLWTPYYLTFLSNLLPFVIATPGLVVVLTRGVAIVRGASLVRCVEFTLLVAGLLACGIGVFGPESRASVSLPALFYAPLPFLLWVAVRFGTGGLSCAFTTFTLVALSGVIAGFGPFASPADGESVLWLQAFLLAVYVPLLVLASLVEERIAKERALSESEARYRGIVEDQTELICRFLPDGTLTFVNGAYCRYFHTTPEQLLGRTFWTLIPPHVHPEARAYLASITPDNPVGSIEHEVIAPGGEVRWHQWRDRAFFDERGRLIDYQAVGRDITERKRAEAEHRQLEAQRLVAEALRDADRRKDEFLAMLAHELRNPLAPVLSAVEVMGQVAVADARLRWARDVIGRQVGQLTRLVDDLLDVSRITRGKINVLMEPLDLRSVIEQAVEISRPLIAERGHALALGRLPAPLLVRGDAVRLAQLVANLLNNAAKYTDPGGAIHVAVAREGGEIVLTVSDSGVGIPADMLDRIFEPFTQAPGSRDRTQGGLGIGLTLARRLAEMHGGRLHAASGGPGRGSTFSVRLPALAGTALPQPTQEQTQEPEPHETAADQEPEAVRAERALPGPASPPRTSLPPLPHPPGNGTGTRRVLVVDDNVDAADSLARVLEVGGHHVEVVHDGRDALLAAERTHPDVVLLDLGMPEMDGLQVARRLRQSRGASRALIVAVTGYGREEDKRRTAEAGFDLHLVKPVDAATLHGLVRRAPRHGG